MGVQGEAADWVVVAGEERGAGPLPTLPPPQPHLVVMVVVLVVLL